METSLSDLFADESPPRKRPRSLSPASHASTPARAVRRPNNTLFLSPGSEREYPAGRGRGRSEIDRSDDEEDSNVLEGLAYDDMLDEDEERDLAHYERKLALKRLADARNGTREREVTPMNIADLESLHNHMDPAGRADEFFNDPFSFQDPLAAGGADEEPPRKKRVVATVDKDRLLGPHGFPALIKLAKRWRPKGKGHEVRDLHRILDVYQMWAHTMFPKGQFMYTVGRVETIARTAGVRAALEGMHDAYKNPQAIPSAEYEFDPDIEAEAAAAESMAEDRAHGIVVVGSNGPTSAPEPLFDQPDGDDDFGFDDELAAMEEMERGAADPQPLGAQDDHMDEMDMAAMDEMEREQESRRDAAATAAAARSASAGGSASENASAAASAATTKPQPLFGDEPPVMDEEDEWEGLYD